MVVFSNDLRYVRALSTEGGGNPAEGRDNSAEEKFRAPCEKKSISKLLRCSRHFIFLTQALQRTLPVQFVRTYLLVGYILHHKALKVLVNLSLM